MARKLSRLSARKVASTLPPGRHADGGGLYLQVARGGSKSWLFCYQLAGRRHDMGLGGVTSVPLAKAREKAAAARALLADGKDPLQERRGLLAKQRGAVTFREAAEAYIAAHAPSWRGGDNVEQWRGTLATYAYPVIGDLPVGDVDQAHVLKILEAVWLSKNATAVRLRSRIENILDAATARGQRAGENPARWRGHLDKLLARPSRVHRVQHLAAMPYRDVPAFMVELRAQPGVAARALEFTILTACRTGEVTGCRWEEIAGDVWTIPAGRMKSNREHRVALSPAALAILDQMRATARGELVFPGRRRGSPLSDKAMSVVLERIGRDCTVHGFRSTFRDWCGERTNFPREVAEMALAHVVGDQTERAYARGDLFIKRQQLMAAWARYCTAPARATKGEVVALGR
jgi:integrase